MTDREWPKHVTARVGGNTIAGDVCGSVLQRQVVNGNVAVHLAGDDSARVVRPFQLPAFLPPFVDLVSEVEALQDLVAAVAREPAVRVVLIIGPPGVGKTTMAVRALRAAAQVFAAGVLYGDLRGFAADGRVGADVLLGRWLTALGERSIPADVEEAS